MRIFDHPLILILLVLAVALVVWLARAAVRAVRRRRRLEESVARIERAVSPDEHP